LAWRSDEGSINHDVEFLAAPVEPFIASILKVKGRWKLAPRRLASSGSFKLAKEDYTLQINRIVLINSANAQQTHVDTQQLNVESKRSNGDKAGL
jgi:hypothetical protein